MIIATIVILFAAINSRMAKCAPSKGQFAEVVFAGLNYYADIFLNG